MPKNKKEEFDVNDWAKEVFGSHLDDDKLEVVKELLAQEDVSKKIREGYLRQSDYSRSMDALKDKEKQTEQKYQEATDFYNKLVRQDHNNQQYVEKLEKELEAARTGGGGRGSSTIDLDDEGKPVFDPKSLEGVITEDKLNEILGEQFKTFEKGAVEFALQINELSQKYHQDFDEYLNTKDLVNHAIENGMTLEDAFNDLTSERYDQKQKEDRQREVDRLVEERLAEERSKLGDNIPSLDGGPTRTHAIRDILRRGTESDMLSKEGRRKAAFDLLNKLKKGERQPNQAL